MIRRKWTEELFNIIRVSAGKMTDDELAKEVTRLSGKIITAAALRKMRQRMGIKKVGGRAPHVVEVPPTSEGIKTLSDILKDDTKSGAVDIVW